VTRIAVYLLYLVFLIVVLVGLLVKPPAEPSYKYQDTIEFCDRETGEAQKTIKNAEFRLLNKDDIMYGIKIEKDQEVLVIDKIPSDCFVSIKKDAQ